MQAIDLTTEQRIQTLLLVPDRKPFNAICACRSPILKKWHVQSVIVFEAIGPNPLT
jgi:hypothetical protein